MTRFRMRALELHSSYVWDFDWIRQALAFIRDHDLTALVLHRNDIVDRVVYPGRLFGASADSKNIFERYKQIYPKLYKYTPTRRSGPYQRRDFLKRVLDLASQQGTDVYFQNKELSFPDILLELYPHLTKNGSICPNDPFWWDFTRTKYTELFQDLPRIKGIITAPGTGESRLAISSNRCRCDQCRESTPQTWYANLIMAMYDPIKAAGKDLIVRDFVFDRKTQTELAETIEALPEDIIVCLKNTPHDYYPTFPDNPRLGQVGPHRQWVEFDCMAQYFGWGVGPSIMIEDMRQRMETAEGHGVEGIVLRTDWESLESHSAFHTPNLINLYAGAALGQDREASAFDIYRDWLCERNMVGKDADPSAVADAVHWTERLLGRSWEVISKSLYTNGCVFSDSSNYPVSLEHAWWLAEEKNSLKDWDPSKADALNTTEENVRRILSEKDAGAQLVSELAAVLDQKPDALTHDAYEDLRERFAVYQRYIRGFCAIGRACILTKYIADHPQAVTPFRAEAETLLNAELANLLALSEEFRDYETRSDHRYTVYVLLGWERLRALHEDLSGRLASIDLAA
ncbi:hypothetical protein [Microvirga aerophila]|uniref:Uncharacterized protein n=1 Tax=Microvirga aerophila TaxID=670291 RepID=A0A512C1X5_9HYPH|nr:hypothetical protein [Microvirga aerophila]GEO18179.1 hypothetical protein MAE02_58750 [Microvirga aerophila]